MRQRQDGQDLVAVDLRARRGPRRGSGRRRRRARCRGRRRARATAACSVPRCVEPQPSLMLSPSGSAPMVMTSAPARREGLGRDPAGGAVRLVQDDCRPSRRLGSAPSRWATYCSKPSSYVRTRPTPEPVGRSQGSPSVLRPPRSASSSSSASLWPPRAKNLMPLSGMALWLAESITPRSAPSRR